MMNVIYKKETSLSATTESSILRILAYFTLFRYPLTKAEIIHYLPPGSRTDQVDDALDQLVADGLVFRIAEFYLLQNESGWVKRRREGNLRAAQLLPTALKIGRFLSGFPFVRGVAISGSLSKMYADEKTDIDFFIITKANRLWIARTIMHIFKKLTYLTGKQDYYCMNYYVDEGSLLLDDQNMYTAVEAITLLPAGGKAMNDFFAANEWIRKWFASYDMKTLRADNYTKRPFIQRLTELLFDHRLGNRLDNYLMKLTTQRWQYKKRKGKRNEEGKAMDLVTGKHFAKSNPGMFREQILTAYGHIISDLKRKAPGYFQQ